MITVMCMLSPVVAEEIFLDGIEPEHLELPQPNVNLKGSLVTNDETALMEIVKNQKDKDREHIEALSKGTVHNNHLIGFSLKKLANEVLRKKEKPAKTVARAGE